MSAAAVQLRLPLTALVFHDQREAMSVPPVCRLSAGFCEWLTCWPSCADEVENHLLRGMVLKMDVGHSQDIGCCPPVVLDSNPQQHLFAQTCLRSSPRPCSFIYLCIIIVTGSFVFHWSVIAPNPDSPCDTRSAFTPDIDPPLQSPLPSTLKHSDIDHGLLKWN